MHSPLCTESQGMCMGVGLLHEYSYFNATVGQPWKYREQKAGTVNVKILSYMWPLKKP